MGRTEQLDDLTLAGLSRALATVAPQLPTLDKVTHVVELVGPAEERGYFFPDEDEQVRIVFANYLTTRAALLSILDDIRPYALNEFRKPTGQCHEVFLIAFTTASLLVRAGRFIVDSFRKTSVTRKKLDEAEPRFGIPAKQFTQVYRSLASPQNILTYLEGIRHFDKHRDDLMGLESNALLAPVVAILKDEAPFIEKSGVYYTKLGFKYRWFSFLRRHKSAFKKFTFGLFKVSGSLIAELRMKWKRKRVTPGVQRKISRLLEPGDIIITRHDDAASNLFLPGFWPHGAFYIGTPQQRRELKSPTSLVPPESVESCVLEARKDGVLFRPLEDTFAVDAFTVLRPKLPKTQIAEAIARGITHFGKQYDFEFDFARSDKLVCTEVIYRAYHGIGDFRFQLKTRAGRCCLSAEDLLDHAVDGSYFDVVAVYGVNGNRFVVENRAQDILRSSYKND